MQKKNEIYNWMKSVFLLLRLNELQKSDIPASAYRPESVSCYLDNIRLARREAKLEHPVLRGEMAKPLIPKAYAVVYEVVTSLMILDALPYIGNR